MINENEKPRIQTLFFMNEKSNANLDKAVVESEPEERWNKVRLDVINLLDHLSDDSLSKGARIPIEIVLEANTLGFII